MKAGTIVVLGFLGGCVIMALLSFAEVDNSTPAPSGATLLAQPVAPAGANLSSVWGQPSDDKLGTVVILAEARDDAAWTKTLPYKAIIMTKGAAEASPYNLPERKGSEAVSYLQFILAHYDDLPPRMIFLNGGSYPEQRPEMPETVSTLDPRSYSYAGFSGMFTCFRAHGPAREGTFIRSCWEEMNGAEVVAPLPDKPLDIISSSCCSNFLVSRDAVLANPKSKYQQLFDWAQSSKLDPENVKQCFSFFWHKLFGRSWRNYQIDANRLCPAKPSTCAHREHVYAVC